MNKNAFTMMELLIVVSIITVLSVGVIALINPFTIIKKGNDIVRKKDLDDAKKMLEQYMNDTGCYPQPTQVCKGIPNDRVPYCNLCSKDLSPAFSHFTKDICDPRHGQVDYLYQTESNLVPKVGYVVSSCPRWFKLFSTLDGPYSSQEDIWGCGRGGCGVSPNYGYSYLVMSPGAPTNDIASQNWYCYTKPSSETDYKCTQCTPYANCTSLGNDCYGKTLYSTLQYCCNEHPGSEFCT